MLLDYGLQKKKTVTNILGNAEITIISTLVDFENILHFSNLKKLIFNEQKIRLITITTDKKKTFYILR